MHLSITQKNQFWIFPLLYTNTPRRTDDCALCITYDLRDEYKLFNDKIIYDLAVYRSLIQAQNWYFKMDKNIYISVVGSTEIYLL